MKFYSFRIVALILMVAITLASCHNNQKRESINSVSNAVEEMAEMNSETAMIDKFPNAKSDDFWKQKLAKKQYEIMVKKEFMLA